MNAPFIQISAYPEHVDPDNCNFTILQKYWLCSENICNEMPLYKYWLCIENINNKTQTCFQCSAKKKKSGGCNFFSVFF